jgi:hypothetical protein
LWVITAAGLFHFPLTGISPAFSGPISGSDWVEVSAMGLAGANQWWVGLTLEKPCALPPAAFSIDKNTKRQ